MRQIFSITSLLLAVIALHAGDSKIKFTDGTWEQTIQKADAENKYVFLDCYTDWCYWCKVMDKETFMDSTVTNMINSKFVPARREMEKSDEGKALSMKYHINGFPTYLIFDESGVLVYEIVGYRNADSFRDELKKATMAKTPLCPGFSSKLDPGFPEFYKNSFGTTKERKKADSKEVNEFLDGQSNLFNEVAWSVMWRFTVSEKYENWILDNRDKLIELYGKDEVEGKMIDIFMARNSAAAEKKDETAFKANLAMMQKYLPDAAKNGYTLSMSAEYYHKSGNWKAYADLIQNDLDTCHAKHDSYINGCAWTVYEECEEEYTIAKAVSWMDNICGRTEEYAYEDTYAALLYKKGDYARAEVVALHAIDLGKEAKEDVSATEALLANIRLKLN